MHPCNEVLMWPQCRSQKWYPDSVSYKQGICFNPQAIFQQIVLPFPETSRDKVTENVPQHIPWKLWFLLYGGTYTTAAFTFIILVQNITHLDRWIDNLICLSFSPYSSHFSNSLLRARGCEPSCFQWLPNYLRAHGAELAARERVWYCFHDRDQWLGECALILQELLSQANKCKPPCWLGCRAEPSGG